MNTQSLKEENVQLRESFNRENEDFTLPSIPPASISRVDGDRVRCVGLPDRELIINIMLLCAKHLNPQAYGNRLEKIFGKMLGLDFIPASEGKGDFYHSLIGHTEGKTSIPKKGKFSIQQIRPARDCQFYLLMMYEWESDYMFFGFVPKKVILNMLGSQSHGTSKSAKDNKDAEFGLRNISINSKGVLSDNLNVIDEYNLYK